MYLPTAPIHRINGMRITHCRAGKTARALQMTIKSPRNIATEHTIDPNRPTTSGFRNASINTAHSGSRLSTPTMRPLRMIMVNSATRIPVFKLESRKLVTVAVNMATVARLENPFRLSSFRASGEISDFGVGENEQEDNDRCREEDNKDS